MKIGREAVNAARRRALNTHDSRKGVKKCNSDEKDLMGKRQPEWRR